MTTKLTVWCLLSALFVVGWSARLVTARFSQIERNATAYFACGTCMSQRAHRVHAAGHWLEGSLASAAISFGLLHGGLRPRWRYGYIAVCAIGVATLAIYFLEMT